MITEMEITWYAYENQCGTHPDLTRAAFKEAKAELNEKHYSRSLLVLLRNEVQQDGVCEDYTFWDPIWSGRARFRVTLIPDKEDTTSSQKNIPRTLEATPVDAPSDATDVGNSALSSSRFADADSEWATSTLSSHGMPRT